MLHTNIRVQGLVDGLNELARLNLNEQFVYDINIRT